MVHFHELVCKPLARDMMGRVCVHAERAMDAVDKEACKLTVRMFISYQAYFGGTKREHVLPDGGTTRDVLAYVAAWAAHWRKDHPDETN